MSAKKTHKSGIILELPVYQIGNGIFPIHLFQQFLFRHGDFAIRGNRQPERHIKVGLRIADAGGIDNA